MCVLKNCYLKNIGKSSYTQKQIYVLILKWLVYAGLCSLWTLRKENIHYYINLVG